MHEQIKSLMLDQDKFPWFYSSSVTDDGQDHLDAFYFTHLFYINNNKNSNYFDTLTPILDILKPNALIRIKGNLYPNLGAWMENQVHVDYPYKHKGAIYYINTNNGYTILEDGTKIESIENRILLFDAATPHSSTHCTDQKLRLNINFNYF